jgi:hypothetical protein
VTALYDLVAESATDPYDLRVCTAPMRPLFSPADFPAALFFFTITFAIVSHAFR